MKTLTVLAVIIFVVGITATGFRLYGGRYHRPVSTYPEVLKQPTTSSVVLSAQIDEHLTINHVPRHVTFCGKTYRAQQIVIDGVDVVQRIAELATDQKKIETHPRYIGTGHICNKLQQNYAADSELHVVWHTAGKIEGGQAVYPVEVAPVSFVVNPDTNVIFEVGGPEFPDPGNFGTFIPIGNLK